MLLDGIRSTIKMCASDCHVICTCVVLFIHLNEEQQQNNHISPERCSNEGNMLGHGDIFNPVLCVCLENTFNV